MKNTDTNAIRHVKWDETIDEYGGAVDLAVEMVKKGCVIAYLTSRQPGRYPLAAFIAKLSEQASDVDTVTAEHIYEGELTKEEQAYYFDVFRDELSRAGFFWCKPTLGDCGGMQKQEIETSLKVLCEKHQNVVVIIEELEYMDIFTNATDWKKRKLAFRELDEKVEYWRGLANKYGFVCVVMDS